MAKKASKAAVSKPKTGKSTKGWFGGEGGSQTSLGQWYGALGKLCYADLACIGDRSIIRFFVVAGEDRDLFLPSGLYAREDIPAYLNGELAGE